MISKFKAAAITGVAVLSVAGAAHYAKACTRIFANDKGGAMLVARSMDWATTTEPVLTVFPRGLVRDGGDAGPMTVVADNPAHWKSQYGSVVTTIFGIGTADGINERGLAAHMLYFPPADYGPRDPSKPGVQAALWAQYALDNAATVEEALAKLASVQIVKVEIEVHGQKQTGTVHVALEDASGNSADSRISRREACRASRTRVPCDDQRAGIRQAARAFEQQGFCEPDHGNAGARQRESA